MTLTEETLRFVREHRKDDVRNLALQARKYPMVDMSAAIIQIAGHQAAEKKVPTWAKKEGILYPAHLSMEQCSSEATARYKAEVVLKSADSNYETFADLTGGFGIDCAFLSACFKRATYVERQEMLCKIAAHNFPLLGLEHIAVCHENSIRYLQTMPPADWIFIDPARRDGHGGKTVAVSDCEPDVSSLEEALLGKARHVLVKLSPMLDLTLALQDLKHVQAAHIVSVNNECKELLLVLERTTDLSTNDIPIYCVNLTASQNAPSIRFTRQQEKEYPCPYTSTLKTYLYEPNASILKAGAFRYISHIYKVEKLHPNSHLYTSNEYIPDFPGRKFRITGSGSPNKRELQTLTGSERKANLSIRNFPTSVTELRKRLKLAEGGDTYLFATTLADERKLLISCRPLASDRLLPHCPDT